MTKPLAAVLRPDDIDDVVGQTEAKKIIKAFLANNNLPSLIFWGPPGSGKTTFAHVLSRAINADFVALSGVSSKKADLTDIIAQAQQNRLFAKKTIVFLDEIHRRNKAQQDSLLPFVEDGTIILIGATTENPSFTINNALISRAKVIVFSAHTEEDTHYFLTKNLSKISEFLVSQNISDIKITPENISTIASLANGDLRSASNLLEASLMIETESELRDETIISAFGKPIYYDRDGEEHYNIISAVHKSLRDSDADAACYWIQRMLAGGEDPLYICRRLLRFASEDIGPADNNALLLANQVYETVQKLGMPECDTAIFQLALYLAKARKDNIAYVIAGETKKDVAMYGNLPVPLHIRNAPTKLMKELEYGKGYKYAHDYQDAKVDQEHFPDKLKGRKYI